MAVAEEPKYQCTAVIRIIKNLFPSDNSGCCKITSPIAVVMRTRTADSP